MTRWLAALDSDIVEAIEEYRGVGVDRSHSSVNTVTPLVAHVARLIDFGLTAHYAVERSDSWTPSEVRGNETIFGFSLTPCIADGAPLSVAVRQGGAELRAGYWYYHVISAVGASGSAEAEADQCRLLVRVVDHITGGHFSERLFGRRMVVDIGPERVEGYMRRAERVAGCPAFSERAKRYLRPKQWAPWVEADRSPTEKAQRPEVRP